jgi:hypothetical protein
VTTQIQAEAISPPRSRRALLASALGGLGAVAAGMLTHRAPANAAEDGDPLLIGVVNESFGETYIIRQDTSGSALRGKNAGIGLAGEGGEVGVLGKSVEVGVIGTSPTGVGVGANSRDGIGLSARSSRGWAAQFDGRVSASRYIEIAEMTTPGRPQANRARLFVRDNGENHTQLCVKFPNGAVRVLATG